MTGRLPAPLPSWVPVLLILTAAACGDRSPPGLEELELAAGVNASAPLAASARILADEPVTVRFRIEEGGRQWEIDPRTGLAAEHELPLLGLRAGTDHTIVAVVSDAAGNEATSDPVHLRTPPLPRDFPDFVVRRSETERMEPGATLFNLMRWPEEGADDEYGALVAVDPRGEVVWYYRAGHGILDARLLPGGTLLYQSGRAGHAYEIDMLGNVIHRWHATGTPKEVEEGSIGVDTETFHHEILEMPSGTLLTLSTEVRDYEAYPSSTVDPEAPTQFASVVGDVVVEFSRDGRVLRELKLLDILDPFRTSTPGSLGGGFWEETYGDLVEGTLIDWAHTNAAFFDPASDAFLVSSRYQDAVVKLDAQTGEIFWILGRHDGWSGPWREHLLDPVGDLQWPNHQHAPMVTPRGTILLFDNGTNRDGPTENGVPASRKYSRAVEYAVDEAAMEVREVWSYGGPGPNAYYASFISDADWLPRTGNVLITAGGVITDASGVATEESDGRRSALIMEVTHERPAEKVFELLVTDDWPTGGWHVYRAQRVPSLYTSGSTPAEGSP